ncbi:unnamed protein product, partial [Urochloa humidicola]
LSSLSLSLSRALSSNPARRWAHHQQQQADFSDEWRDACSSAELARQACALAAAAMGERRESGPDTGQREEEGSSQADLLEVVAAIMALVLGSTLIGSGFLYVIRC